MKIRNPFSALTKAERLLYGASLTVIVISFVFAGDPDLSVLVASLLGATALIFVAKGDPFGQILTVVFSLFYGWISLCFRYYGEMITYLCMTSPIAVASAVAWYKNPYEKGKAEVKVSRITKKMHLVLWPVTAMVTFVFYFILKFFETPNLIMSTVSIATSFSASALTLLRSPYYALAYAANDIVLIILWTLATIEDPGYLPMIFCFVIFLVNDTYGFFNWSRIQKKQARRDFESN